MEAGTQAKPRVVKAVIRDRKEIAKETLLVTFDLHGEQVNFRPGQYFFITIPNMPYADDRGNRRHFSIVNSPNEKGIISMATRWRKTSGFKTALRDMPLGTEVEIGRITGDFVLPEDASRPLVFIAGGIGITPFISMLRYVKETGSGHRITLLCSNRSRETTAFLDELQEMARTIEALKLVLTMSDDPTWPGEKRTIDAQFIKDHVPDSQPRLFMIAGPPGMDEAMGTVLTQVGVDRTNIKVERFTGY